MRSEKRYIASEVHQGYRWVVGGGGGPHPVAVLVSDESSKIIGHVVDFSRSDTRIEQQVSRLEVPGSVAAFREGGLRYCRGGQGLGRRCHRRASGSQDRETSVMDLTYELQRKTSFWEVKVFGSGVRGCWGFALPLECSRAQAEIRAQELVEEVRLEIVEMALSLCHATP